MSLLVLEFQFIMRNMCALLEGLPSDYALVISVIESKKRTPSIAEIEALFYGHETHLVRYNKETQALSSPS